jgi:hypothetical protein
MIVCIGVNLTLFDVDCNKLLFLKENEFGLFMPHGIQPVGGGLFLQVHD